MHGHMHMVLHSHMGGIKDIPSISRGRALHADPICSQAQRSIGWVGNGKRRMKCAALRLEFFQVRLGRTPLPPPTPPAFKLYHIMLKKARTEAPLYYGSKS